MESNQSHTVKLHGHDHRHGHGHNSLFRKVASLIHHLRHHGIGGMLHHHRHHIVEDGAHRIPSKTH